MKLVWYIIVLKIPYIFAQCCSCCSNIICGKFCKSSRTIQCNVWLAQFSLIAISSRIVRIYFMAPPVCGRGKCNLPKRQFELDPAPVNMFCDFVYKAKQSILTSNNSDHLSNLLFPEVIKWHKSNTNCKFKCCFKLELPQRKVPFLLDPIPLKVAQEKLCFSN